MCLKQLFINGNIYTGNEAQEWAEAMYVKDGIIAYVGTTREAQNKAGANASTTNLRAVCE